MRPRVSAPFGTPSPVAMIRPKLVFQLFVFQWLSGMIVTGVKLCGQQQHYTSLSGKFAFGTNQWGDDGSGSQCIDISGNDTVFSATWQWNNNPASVHSYPNINRVSKLLPLRLSNLSSLVVTASWSMAPEGSNVLPIDSQGLLSLGTRSNIVIDMFLDPDPKVSTQPSAPKYEIMVWIGGVGDALPIGFSKSQNLAVYRLGGTEYTLYKGANQNNQIVYSWISATNKTDFSRDLSPLINHLSQQDYIPSTNYLGSCQFGTEAFHATSNVTFTTWNFNITINEGALNSSAAPNSDSDPGTSDGLISGPTSAASIMLFQHYWLLVILFYIAYSYA